MEIKNVDQYQVVGEKQYLPMALIVGSVFGSLGLIGQLTAYLPENTCIALFAFGMLSTVVLAVLGANQEIRRDEVAKDEYRQFTLDLLKRGSTSLELSSRTRDVIISLLNQGHTGWSLK